MEVASPLTFEPRTAGTKRHLSTFSPTFADSTSRTPLASGLERNDGTGSAMQQRSFKRRRFNIDSSMDDAENITPQFLGFSVPPSSSGFSSPGSSTLKRCRTETASPPQDLRPLVESQASEIESLKSDKSNLEASLNGLQTEHEKVVKENKLLRKAVTIQQDRQNHANNELEAARKYKSDAEQQIRRLEQMVLTLRYHLEAQQNRPGNDFMGFPPRPPDVY